MSEVGPQPDRVGTDGVDHRRLVEREELLRVILDRTADAIVRFDPRLRYDFVNDRAAAMSGIAHDDWLGRTQGELGFPPEEVAVREERIRKVFATGDVGTYVDEIENVEGRSYFEMQLFPQHDASGSVAHVIVVARDITPRVLAERRLVDAARTDPLTGLANRTALIEDVDSALAAARRSGTTAALLLVDLDHFKFVNDSLGHGVGDLFLRYAAERIQDCVRPGDLVARHGGDEFVIVLHDLRDPSVATDLAERIVDRFRLPLVCEGTDVSTTASVGIALDREGAQGHDAHDLIREADTAMFVAKDAGRDGWAVFDEALHHAAQERFRIATELRMALAHDELEVWYQPEVDLTDGSLQAVEALLRWRHPSGEVYAAGRFIDIAAETGLIVDIGYRALDRICEQAARWSGHDLVVRMNLAPRQLADTELLRRVDDALGRHGLDGACLCVEITETALLHDNSTVRENLAGLSARGIPIAVDDFGTGYASLTYLRRYEIDVIKIDRSFVTDIARRPRDRDVAAAIVSLGQHLGMTVTAEGIEEREQADVLAALGCTIGQGFLYGAAVPAEEIDELLANG